MSTPDSSPKDYKRFPKEGEPKPNGFHIRVEKPDLILKSLQDVVEGELGTILLEDPIEEVKLESIRSEDNTLNLMSSIDLRTMSFQHTDTNVIDALGEFANQYGLLKERGGNYFIKAKSGNKLLVSHGSLRGYKISTGVVVNIHDEVKQLFPAPKYTEESLNTTLDDIEHVTKKLIGFIYKKHGKTTPVEEMIVGPPKRKYEMNQKSLPKDLVGKLEIEKPNVAFEDIGGLKEAKREIQGLAFALKNPELYRKWGTKPPKGILLFGPPGTGKTLLAKALASQAEARFFHVQASDIASKWYGESEQIVDEIFDLAGKSEGKTIIFFDEVDAMAPHRTGAHEATQRVIGTMLEKMDGLTSNDNVMVIASTNRLEEVEPALLRAGRFDRWVEAPLPDEEGRNQIFTIHMRKAEKLAERELFSGINQEVIISKAQDLSGADIAEVVRRSLEEKVRQEGMGNGVNPVNTEDMLKELELYEKVRETKRQIKFLGEK